MGAQLLEPGGANSQLPHLVDLEFFGLTLHLLEEDAQVNWDLIVTNQVVGVLSNVKLLAKLLAHLVDLADGVGVLHVGLLGVLEPNRAENLKLFVDSLIVLSFLLFSEVELFLVFSIGDARNGG